MMENIKRLFENDKDRVKKFSRTLQLNDEFIYFDFSKTHVSDQDIESLLKKLESKDIYKKINDMFEGKKINYTENREVLHVLLRDKHVLRSVKSGDKGDLRDESVMVYEELIKMRDFVEKFHQGRIRGVNNKILDTIVNIGIGGSDLGPRMVCESLVHYSKRNIKTYFISNIDATDSLEVFDKINPDTTLFIVVSKTFTTLETIKNAELAIKLMKKSLNRSGEEICKHHFVAVSSNQEEVAKYNISTVFTMWDFVGGRYSLWSAVGLSIALYIGFENFLELLSGASMVDEKFKSLQELDNIEIMHALIEIFYSENGYNNKCLVSYDQYLEKMYLYLQQSEMESNGKYSENTETGMIIWGGVGTNVQHSFFQLLHQGTRKILAEFLFPFSPLNEEENHHNMVLSNCLAQSMALMEGKAGEKGVDYFPGNRPSIILGYSKLTPKVLGALIAHYEHKIFVQGIYWEINSYDQFGVTLGKKIASTLLSDIESKKRGNFDESTNSILKKLFELK